MELAEDLFRREHARLTAVLAGLFGLRDLALAEDVVQDAFRQALETWPYYGVPKNPSAWLMTTAKNRALDVLRREQTARKHAPELARRLESEWTRAPAVDELFAPGAIKDAELRMMFSCARPDLSEEARLALVLHLLCGFGVDEIAAAFLKKRDAMEKRLVRAKKELARAEGLFDLTSADVAERLPAVLRALYLLFNEGYHGASAETPVRAELCREARRLAASLLEDPRTDVPAARALAALFAFLAARLPGRTDEAGELASLEDQDRSRWDADLIAEGIRHLDRSARGEELTPYHLEAAIAAEHARAARAADTDWGAIVALYDRLLAREPSPVVALNRAIAVAQRDGPESGLREIGLIEDRARLERYPFYHAALGELERRRGRAPEARAHLLAARGLARSPAERRFLDARLAGLP